jgi:uncharacterized coiled-coil DUF342 family protein
LPRHGAVAANTARIFCHIAVPDDFALTRISQRRNVYGAIMEAMRESWTDDRLDDLNGKVDVRLEMKTEFGSVRSETKAEFATVRTEMREGFERIEKRFDRIDERFDKVDERFQRVDERFEAAAARSEERFEAAGVRSEERFEAMMDRLFSMQRQMIQAYAGLFVALFVAVAGFVSTQL